MVMSISTGLELRVLVVAIGTENVENVRLSLEYKESF